MSGGIALSPSSIDEADWPIVRVRWALVSVGVAELDAFADAAERIYARGERFAVLVDARGAAPLGPLGIARAIRIEARHARLARDVLVARAVILEHDAAVRTLTTVLRALPLRVPTRPFASPTSAEAWLRTSLDGGGTRTGLAT